MSRKNLILLAVYVAFTLGISLWLGQRAYQWLPPAAAQEAQPVGDLFSFLVSLGSVVFLGVAGAMAYSIIFYRFSLQNPQGAPIRGNARLEIFWTVVPIILVTWIAWYSYVIYQRMNVLGPLPVVEVPQLLGEKAIAAGPPAELAMAQGSNINPEKIGVEVKQWLWTFTYPNAGVTSHELHLPLDRRVTLNMTSADVLHGFYVPNFRIKQDIVPNREIEFSFTPNRLGEYKLHDSQFSGTYFAVMTAPVVVQSVSDYQAWLESQKSLAPGQLPNPALDEFNQTPGTPLKSGWPTVSPATRK
ncbi:cytochrome c oxidase subunit II [Synechocystis sp. LEGE 06083]|uniref:cytochrome c oxidase subunit II n=1 Tax=Synechocystis sp. LEGE 06083 TaxID=915336 RepID=UPI0018805664|nr:cytochrome c oxidase subunit II [Synechocystis sp. LEGE 06083]MBE9194594.1 cytochrome c oxidase subunit II [Synechocystis sp. LEGE 06083]